MIHYQLHDKAYKKPFLQPLGEDIIQKNSTVLLMLLSPHLLITKKAQTFITSEQNFQ